jgi:hypothetical protein
LRLRDELRSAIVLFCACQLSGRSPPFHRSTMSLVGQASRNRSLPDTFGVFARVQIPSAPPAIYGPRPRARVEVQTRFGTRLQSYIRSACRASDEALGLDGFPRASFHYQSGGLAGHGWRQSWEAPVRPVHHQRHTMELTRFGGRCWGEREEDVHNAENTFFAKSIPIVVTSISDPPRFVRMSLSTSWAHCEAVYKRAGVHTISPAVVAFSGTQRDMARARPASFSAIWSFWQAQA